MNNDLHRQLTPFVVQGAANAGETGRIANKYLPAKNEADIAAKKAEAQVVPEQHKALVEQHKQALARIKELEGLVQRYQGQGQKGVGKTKLSDALGGGGTPAAAPPAPTSPAPSAGKYTHTATGPNGQKMGFNEQTNQWENL